MGKYILVDLMLYGSALIMVLFVLVSAGMTILWVVSAPFIWVGEKIYAHRKDSRG